MSLRRSVLTEKCSYVEASSRPGVFEAKCPHGGVSLRQSVLTAKCPTAKYLMTKSTTVKSQGTFKNVISGEAVFHMNVHICFQWAHNNVGRTIRQKPDIRRRTVLYIYKLFGSQRNVCIWLMVSNCLVLRMPLPQMHFVFS